MPGVFLRLCLLFLTHPAAAVQLPTLASLEKDASLHPQTVEVIEPHASTPERPVRVAYVGVPVRDALTQWFGAAWQQPGTEVVFIAQDGYTSMIPAEKFARQTAYLAYARADGAPFELDNWEQRERVPLEPYYLVWDNLRSPELRQGGSAGWPYQITRIKLREISDYEVLRVSNADPETVQGMEETVTNCLTCHHLRGFGGKKVPEDLAASLCRWLPAELRRWIDEPSRLRPGSTMPAINRAWPEEQRRRVAGLIVRYLDAVKQSDPAACGKGVGR